MAQQSHDELLAALARDYYLEQHSVQNLITKYKLSRYLIMKYLQEARDSGIVKIRIQSQFQRNTILEQELKEKFPIKNVVVLKSGTTPLGYRKQISKFAAQTAQRLIANSHVVGLSWGENIYSLIDSLEQTVRDDLTFTQFMGESLCYHSTAGSMRLVQLAAAKYSCHYRTMPGTLYVIDDAVRAGYEREPAMVKALNTAAKMDGIITSVSSIHALNATPIWKNNYEQIFPNIAPEKIAGFIFGRPYDIDGNFLTIGSDKTLGLPLPALLNVRFRFGVIQDNKKVHATLGALRGGFFTDLVLTEDIALRILKIDHDY